MSEFDDDLEATLADLSAQGLGEAALWSAGGSGPPIPVTVMADELPDSIAVQLTGTADVRLIDVTVAMTALADPKRDDEITFSDALSPFYGTWTALGCERRTRTHRVIRCRTTVRRRSGDAGAREIRR